jgi:hypothetical protein
MRGSQKFGFKMKVDANNRSHASLVVEDLYFLDLPKEIIDKIYYDYIFDIYVHPW